MRVAPTSVARAAVLTLSTLSSLVMCRPPTGPSLDGTVLPPPTPSPTVETLPSPSPSATPQPLPRLTPAVVRATISAGEARLAAHSVEPLCLRWQDSDDDGDPEWVGLYVVPAEPPQVQGFVLDGADWFELTPPPGEEEHGLGEYPTCELEVNDLNADGRTEIAVWGHRGGNVDLLHLFAWNGSHYALLGAFEGAGGLRLEDATGDRIEDVIVRLRPEGDLVREIIYEWNGSHYAWTWDRYAWYFPDRPHPVVDDTPVHALASFYLALDDRDLPGAYSLLSADAQAAQPYEQWTTGFATTLEVEVSSPRVVEEGGNWAIVVAQVLAVDNERGRAVATLYDVEWRMIRTAEGWRLDLGAMEALESHELPYYP